MGDEYNCAYGWLFKDRDIAKARVTELEAVVRGLIDSLDNRMTNMDAALRAARDVMSDKEQG